MSGARLGVTVVTAAACFFAGRALLGSERAAAESERLALPPLPAEARRDLALVRVQGQVERGAADAGVALEGDDRPLAPGETLRVGGGSSVTLRLGIASAIELSPGTVLTAVSTAPSEIALQLDEGRARVTLPHPGRTLRVRSPDGGEVIAAGGAATRFLVAAHPGRLSVFNDADAAPVRLHAAGAEVEVPENRVSWSVSGAAPRPPIEPPTEPGLEVEGAALAPPPEAPPTGADEKERAAEPNEEEPAPAEALVVVRGRAHPLALVKISGATTVQAVVGADGSFAATLPRQDAPYAVVASLPTGSEALLEVTPPGADESPPSDPSVAAPLDDPPAEGALETDAEPAPETPPAAREPTSEPEPKPKKVRKRRRPQRQKAAGRPKAAQTRKQTQKQTPKPAAKKKRTGAVTWGATP